MEERLQKQLDFILEIDKIKQINRQTYLADGSRKENDAEHSWHLAVMCLLLAEHSNQEIDILKTMAMVLIHDVIEIDAGDTYAYDEVANATKAEREKKAAERLYSLLPDDQGAYLKALWEEFEEKKTKEALFANALDKVQPILLNVASSGRAWREHDVCASQVLNRNKLTPEGSQDLWGYCLRLIEKNVELGNLRNE
ncbi:MAG: HD domain-containing protein [Lachnospiraceae bacterium]|nr:HD domain-containing protein [Lachnospiraceae bacterium]